MKKVKFLLDTDIGDDIDDAFALALAYYHPSIDLVGVTTVFRNTDARSKQVLAFMESVGEDNVPVRSGIGTPIKEKIHYFSKENPKETTQYPCQYSDDYRHYQVEKESAIDFIYGMASKYQGELVLAPIGPLTNIAMAIKKYPDIKNKIQKIVLMGGWFTNEVAEWNILCDPESADIVFSSGIEIYAVGLDVTLQCPFEKELLTKLSNKKAPFQVLLMEWFVKWQTFFEAEKSVMHDPLALATLVDDGVCKFEKKYVKVDLELQRGVTKIVPQNQGGSLVNVATSVDKNVFYKHFEEVILK